MILRRVARDYFLLDTEDGNHDCEAVSNRKHGNHD